MLYATQLIFSKGENVIKQGVLLIALILVFPCSGSAVSLRTTDGFEIGVQVSGYKYEEPGIMNLKGVKLGLTGGAVKNIDNAWYVAGDLRFAFGDVYYTGSGTKTYNPDRLWDLRARGGKDFAAGESVLSPYAGLGYQTLFNDLRGTSSTGAVGYRRNSEYWYLPLGVTHRFRAGSDSRISTSLEFDYLIIGRQKTYKSDVDPGFNDLLNKQKHGYGLRLSTAYEKSEWSVGVFYYYWNIEASESADELKSGVLTGTGLEPKNDTNEYGVQIKYRF